MIGNWIGVSFDDCNVMIGVKLVECLYVKVGDMFILVNGSEC